MAGLKFSINGEQDEKGHVTAAKISFDASALPNELAAVRQARDTMSENGWVKADLSYRGGSVELNRENIAEPFVITAQRLFDSHSLVTFDPHEDKKLGHLDVTVKTEEPSKIFKVASDVLHIARQQHKPLRFAFGGVVSVADPAVHKDADAVQQAHVDAYHKRKTFG